MLFDRAEKPNTTIEEWGVITRTGLFAHGTDPNPLVGPSSYICHSGTGSAQGLEVIRKNCFDWTKKYEKQQAESLLPTKWSVKCLIEKLNDTRFTASDVQQSAPHPTAINVVRSFNATSTEHELYEKAFSGIGVFSHTHQKRLVDNAPKVDSVTKPKPLALPPSHTSLTHQHTAPGLATSGLQLPSQETLQHLSAWDKAVKTSAKGEEQVVLPVVNEVQEHSNGRRQTASGTETETETETETGADSLFAYDAVKSDKQFESVQTELNQLENELNEMLRKFELQNLIKSKIEQTQSEKLKEAVEKARDAAERFDHAVHCNSAQVQHQHIAAIPAEPPSAPLMHSEEQKSSTVSLSISSTFDTNTVRRRGSSKPRQKSPKSRADREKLLLRDIERLTRKLELYRPYNDEEAGFADDEEEHKDEESCTKKISTTNDSNKKSAINPVYNAVHELMNEVEA